MSHTVYYMPSTILHAARYILQDLDPLALPHPRATRVGEHLLPQRAVPSHRDVDQRALRRPRLEPWLRTNGVNTNGAAAKVINFDRLGKKVRPGTLAKCSDPIRADPVRPFPKASQRPDPGAAGPRQPRRGSAGSLPERGLEYGARAPFCSTGSLWEQTGENGFPRIPTGSLFCYRILCLQFPLATGMCCSSSSAKTSRPSLSISMYEL